MKLRLLLLGLLPAAGLLAQQPVAYSLADAAARIPLPPTTPAEAAALAVDDNGLQLAPVVNDLTLEFTRQMTAISQPPSMAELSDPATAAKLEQMSDAEKVQFAMQMQAKLAAAQAARARPGVITADQTALIKRCEAAVQARQQRLLAGDNLVQRRAQHDGARLQQLEEAHAKIDAEADANRSSLGHEGDNIPAEKIRAYEAAVWKKHLDAEAAFLAERRAEWDQFKAARLKDLTAIDADLKSAKYGDGAGSYVLSILSQHQLMGIEDLNVLLQSATQDVLHAAGWQQRFAEWQAANK